MPGISVCFAAQLCAATVHGENSDLAE